MKLYVFYFSKKIIDHSKIDVRVGHIGIYIEEINNNKIICNFLLIIWQMK